MLMTCVQPPLYSIGLANFKILTFRSQKASLRIKWPIAEQLVESSWLPWLLLLKITPPCWKELNTPTSMDQGGRVNNQSRQEVTFGQREGASAWKCILSAISLCLYPQGMWEK